MRMISYNDVIRLADKAHREPVHPNKMFPPSAYYRFMRLLAREVQPDVSVVLGVCGGGDCLHLCEGHDHKVYGVDVAYDHAVNILTIRGMYPKFTFVKADSVSYASAIAEESVDILFIDTTHTYEQTMAEYRAWLPNMTTHGIILLDDLYRNGMQQAWDEIVGSAKIRRDDLHIGGAPDEGGFGIVLL